MSFDYIYITFQTIDRAHQSGCAITLKRQSCYISDSDLLRTKQPIMDV